MPAHSSERTAYAPRGATLARADRIDDVMARVAAQLRALREPLQPAELDELAHDIVLDVARFVLEWTERRETPSRAELPRHAGIVAGRGGSTCHGD